MTPRERAENVERAMSGAGAQPCPHLTRTLYDCHWPLECRACRIEHIAAAIALAEDDTRDACAKVAVEIEAKNYAYAKEHPECYSAYYERSNGAEEVADAIRQPAEKRG